MQPDYNSFPLGVAFAKVPSTKHHNNYAQTVLLCYLSDDGGQRGGMW